MPAEKIKNLPETYVTPDKPPPPGTSKFSKEHAENSIPPVYHNRFGGTLFLNGKGLEGKDPLSLAGEKPLTIKQTLNRIHKELAPPMVVKAFQKYWPGIKKMTMKEAWLRIVYMEAIGGAPWATTFIANRTEGLVDANTGADNRGSILEAIQVDMDNPV
jgi:hypothetical protein